MNNEYAKWTERELCIYYILTKVGNLMNLPNVRLVGSDEV